MFWSNRVNSLREIIEDHTQAIDGALVIAAFGVDPAARKAGRFGRPQFLSDEEREMLAALKRRSRRRREDIEEEVTRIKTALAALPYGDDEWKSDLRQTVTSQVMSTFQNLSGIITRTVVGEREGSAEFQAYVHRHGLEHKAKYVASRVKHFAILAALGLAEICCQSVMYINANAAGWFGSLLTAGLVTSVTMGCAIIFGPVIRYVNLPNLEDQPNRRRNARLWSIPVLVLCVIVVIGTALLSAHYREVAASAEDFQESLVLEHFLAHPLSLGLASWGVFFLQCLSAVVAAWKSFTSTDRVVGYETADRAYREVEDAKIDLAASIKGQLEAIKAAEVDARVERRQSALAMLADLRKRVIDLDRNIQKVASQDEVDSEAFSLAIARFRTVSSQVRGDSYSGEQPTDLLAGVPAIKPHGLSDMIDRIGKALRDGGEADAETIERERERIEIAKESTEHFMEAIAAASKAPGQKLGVEEIRKIILSADREKAAASLLVPKERPALPPSSQALSEKY